MDDWSSNRIVLDNMEMGSSDEMSLDMFDDGSENRSLDSVNYPFDVSKAQMNPSFPLHSLLNLNHSFLPQALAEIETAVFEGCTTEMFRSAKGIEARQLVAFLD